MATDVTRDRAPQRPAAEPVTSLVEPTDDQTAATILQAAVDVISRRGYHGTSVRDIAAAAKVSPGTIYNHFGSKHDVLATIMDRGIDALVTTTEAALYASPPDPAVRLCAIVGVHVANHAREPRESYIGNSELRSLEPATLAVIIAKRDAQMRMFHRVVEDGVATGDFATSSARETARYIVTACTAVATWYRADRRLSIDELIEEYQRISLAAAGYRGDWPLVEGGRG